MKQTLAAAARAALRTPWDAGADGARYAAEQYMLGAALAHDAPRWYAVRRDEFARRARLEERIAALFPASTAAQQRAVSRAAFANMRGFSRMVAQGLHWQPPRT